MILKDCLRVPQPQITFATPQQPKGLCSITSPKHANFEKVCSVSFYGTFLNVAQILTVLDKLL